MMKLYVLAFPFEGGLPLHKLAVSGSIRYVIFPFLLKRFPRYKNYAYPSGVVLWSSPELWWVEKSREEFPQS